MTGCDVKSSITSGGGGSLVTPSQTSWSLSTKRDAAIASMLSPHDVLLSWQSPTVTNPNLLVCWSASKLLFEWSGMTFLIWNLALNSVRLFTRTLTRDGRASGGSRCWRHTWAVLTPVLALVCLWLMLVVWESILMLLRMLLRIVLRYPRVWPSIGPQRVPLGDLSGLLSDW